MSLMTLWTGVLILGVFSLALFTGLFIARIIRNRLVTRREQQRAAISRALLAVMENEPDALAPYARKDLLVAETAVRLADMVRGPELERLQAALKSFGLGPQLITRLDRGRKRQRMVAAEALSLIPGSSTVEALNAARGDKSGEVRILSIFSLLTLDHAPAIPDMLETLRSGPWSRSLLVTDLLRKMGRENQAELAAEIQRDDLPAPIQVMLLDAVEGAGEFAALPQVAAQASDHNPAIRGAAVRAMGRLGHPYLSPTINRALEDRSWAVRRDAIGAARRAGLHELAPGLKRRLNDDVWEVRHDAAVALSDLGQPGRTALDEAMAESEPRRRAEIEMALDESRSW